jgi:hypothetical protein
MYEHRFLHAGYPTTSKNSSIGRAYVIDHYIRAQSYKLTQIIALALWPWIWIADNLASLRPRAQGSRQ